MYITNIYIYIYIAEGPGEGRGQYRRGREQRGPQPGPSLGVPLVPSHTVHASALPAANKNTTATLTTNYSISESSNAQ